jgi:hypothetical protein
MSFSNPPPHTKDIVESNSTEDVEDKIALEDTLFSPVISIVDFPQRQVLIGTRHGAIFAA